MICTQQKSSHVEGACRQNFVITEEAYESPNEKIIVPLADYVKTPKVIGFILCTAFECFLCYSMCPSLIMI